MTSSKAYDYYENCSQRASSHFATMVSTLYNNCSFILSQCLQKSTAAVASECVFMWERVKGKSNTHSWSLLLFWNINYINMRFLLFSFFIFTFYLPLLLPNAYSCFCNQRGFMWNSSQRAACPEICIPYHLDITFYKLSYWTNNGVVQYSTWKSELCEIRQWKQEPLYVIKSRNVKVWPRTNSNMI